MLATDRLMRKRRNLTSETHDRWFVERRSVMTLDRASTVKDHCDGDLACDSVGTSAASSGKTLSLADDAFTKTDAVVLATVGQSAGGRMLPPTMILQLRLAAQGCQLQLDGHDRAIVLPGCACRAQGSNRH